MKRFLLITNILICTIKSTFCSYNLYEGEVKVQEVNLTNSNDSQAQNTVPSIVIENNMRGGAPTDIKQYPFVVSIQKHFIPRCAGSLIAASWVLTAGHCLIDLNRRSETFLEPDEFSVISGRTIMTAGVTEGQERKVDMFFLHSRFEKQNLKYDVGLLRTTDPFFWDQLTRPIELNKMSPEVETVFQYCTLIGWNIGQHSFDDYEPPELEPNTRKLEVMKLRMMNFQQCKGLLDGSVSLDSVCSNLDGKCPGQSGSPLICGEALYGILTWTSGCTNQKMPAIFARISKIHIWIHNVTQGVYTEAHRRIRSDAYTFPTFTSLQWCLQIYNFLVGLVHITYLILII